MKQRHIGFLLFFGLLVVRASITTTLAEDKQISDEDLTCQVYGSSFVLDDTDFKALTQEKLGKYKVSKERFASLEPTSNIRAAICDTRKLWRLLKAGNAGECDLQVHYKNYAVAYFDKSELDKLNAALAKSTAQAFAGTATKCR